MNDCRTTPARTDESVCFTIVETVAEMTDSDPLELEPLGTVVDTDALATLFGGSERLPGHDAYLTFRYEGCIVSVDGEGSVSVSRLPSVADAEPAAAGMDAESVGSE